jgi:hypothetical protein
MDKEFTGNYRKKNFLEREKLNLITDIEGLNLKLKEKS